MIRSIKPSRNLSAVMALCAAAVFGPAGTASATLVAYEGFNYTAASILTNNISSGTGWGLNWSIDGSSAGNGVVGASSLGSSTSLATSGQSIAFGNGTIYTRQLQNTLGTSASGGVLWASVLYLGLNATGNESRIGFYSGLSEGAVIDGNTATAGATQVVDVGRSALSGAPDEISLYNTTSTYTSSGVATPRGSTAALLVLRFNLNGTAATDTLSLWINPDLSLGEGLLGTAQATWTTANLDDINGFRFQAGNTGAFGIDEIRLGTTFGDVTPIAAVPEPTAAALVALGGMALLFVRAKRA